MATGVTKTAITATPAVLTNGGKDVHFHALTPKELRNHRHTRSCWIVSTEFGGEKKPIKANRHSCTQDGEL